MTKDDILLNSSSIPPTTEHHLPPDVKYQDSLKQRKNDGVRYNMDKDWVGGTVAYFEK